MPEPALVSYENVPPSLVGSSSDNFFLPSLTISVLGLLNFKLASFPGLANSETLTQQTILLVSSAEPDTQMQNDALRSLIPPPFTVLQQLIKRGLEGTFPVDGNSILCEGRCLPIDVLGVWMALAAVHHIRGRWDKALRWLKKQERKNGILYDRVISLLQNTPWCDFVHGFDSTDNPP